MRFFKRRRILRRYGEQKYEDGYAVIDYEDMELLMDIQTTEATIKTDPDGRETIQKLKVFCDTEILTENTAKSQKADRVWFQGKWFDCISSRLSENTPLRHWTSTFVECLDQEDPPGINEDGNEDYNPETGEIEEPAPPEEPNDNEEAEEDDNS